VLLSQDTRNHRLTAAEEFLDSIAVSVFSFFFSCSYCYSDCESLQFSHSKNGFCIHAISNRSNICDTLQCSKSRILYCCATANSVRQDANYV